LSYKGVFTAGAGNWAPEGPYYFTFNIYNGPGPAAALWTECQTLTVTKGGFNAILGSVTPLSTLAFDTQYYLGFSVSTAGPCPATPELLPRVVLAASPYSLSGPNGSGTANFVTKFLAGKTVGNSPAFDPATFVRVAP